MSTSLLRGLRALEMLGTEALGVSEIARRLGVDKAGVSRMLGQLHAEGWVLRTGARYVLGERALTMATTDPAGVRRRATRVAAQLHERTGLTAVVLRLSGDGSQPVAVAGPTDFLEPDEPFEHLWSTAGGVALLAQLPDPELERRLAVSPWPRPSAAAPRDAADVRRLVRAVRSGSAAEERSWTIAGVSCVALPWPLLEPAPPYAVLAVGPTDDLERDPDAVRQAVRDAVAG
ncbi:helix-turn-helix domain-containing protein [Nocardioides sp. QY071]|uniref:IclR family transcriptional regulator n=1 Tax=Nocardioides sp. QY071 TaxID=3044187 RepID=UPI00249A5CD9|nr:helix-turn-helix domain-containing protein [Nocardioides sp. QY071]WGY01735.1 helix-turn-helix domain-containing protein [Nocardioides sp. QY071]